MRERVIFRNILKAIFGKVLRTTVSLLQLNGK